MGQRPAISNSRCRCVVVEVSDQLDVEIDVIDQTDVRFAVRTVFGVNT